MDELIRSVEDHRLDREAGAIVYPVISRRARGLSVGINLFPDRKICSFDCPYCEVFPFQTDITLSLQAMERGLQELAKGLQRGGMAEAVRDLSFSGNGEPTLHPDFIPALTLAARLRHELFEVHQPEVKLVLITNGTGLMDTSLASFLTRAARGEAPYFDTPHGALEIWLKVDAGTEFWYGKMNRSAIPLSALHGAIRAFSLKAPFIIQTMICKVDGELPPEDEVTTREELIRELVVRASTLAGPQAGPQAVHLYSKARPAPEDPKAEPVDEAYLAKRRASLQKALVPYRIPIEVFV